MANNFNLQANCAGWGPPGTSYWLCTLLDRAPVMANVNGKVKKMRWLSGPDEGTFVWRNRETEYITERFLGWAQDRPGPWCVTLSISAPHDPYTPSEAAVAKWNEVGVPLPKTDAWNADDEGKPGYLRRGPLTEAEKAEIEADWTGKMRELMDVDAAMERLCSEIDFEDTYLIFLSDNGYQLGEHRLFKKQRPYPESTRTPLFVRGPGIEPREDGRLVSSLDVFATIAELAGVDDALPGDPDGRSLSPLLFAAPVGISDEGGEPAWRTSLLMEQGQEYGPEHGAWRAVRTAGGDLYVEHASGDRELYPASDARQLTNAVGDESEAGRVADLSRLLSGLKDAEGGLLRAAETGTS